ncbi:MAG: sensor histidine kinase [Actinomycetota bacterium]
MSLRARLLIATVALVGIGLLIANGATYALLRSSLIDRVDQQLSGSYSPAVRQLVAGERGPRRGPFRGGGDVPPSTYAQMRSPSGEVIAERSFGFGAVTARPNLPAKLPGAESASSRQRQVFTADSTGGGHFRYRVMATPIPGERGTVVVAIPLAEVDATLHRLVLVEAIVTAAVLVAMAAAATWMVRVGLRPLQKMGDTADAIAGGDLSRRVEPAEPRTEVGRLGLALNSMLERIENAFAEKQASENRLRRFVADASHELRTPLTSIRGYAELFRRGADSRPDDLAKTMQRIEDESERMGKLVEELLTLARLDQGHALELQPVDLTKLARDAVEDFSAADGDHPADLDASESIMVEADEHRLRQVLANLLGNARVHTPAGTPVHVRLGSADSRAWVEVEDEGPGLAAEDASRVFDRFFRVDPSRSRDKGGAGLGLSIASAIAEAHGGSISLRSAPGAGSTFRLELPLS